MVRSYTRYELDQSFGVVVSNKSNVLYVNDAPKDQAITNKSSGCALVAALESILVWDVKKGEKKLTWTDKDCKAEVSQLARNPADPDIFAAGYTDGSIRLWSLESETPVVTLNGHRSAVTALRFDDSGTKLASGARDTHVVIWDVIAEVGVSRLKGHRDEITSLAFVSLDTSDLTSTSHLLTTSKDSYLKLWELSTSHCIETHTAHRGECWAMALSPDGEILTTAGLEGELKLWTLDKSANIERNEKVLTLKGTINRTSKARPCTLTFHPSGEYLAAQGADKAIEIFRLRSGDEIEKLVKRRRKRRKDKKTEDGMDLDDEDENVKFSDNIVSYVTIRTTSKIRSVDWGTSDTRKTSSINLLTTLNNNTIELYSIPTYESLDKKSAPEYSRPYILERPGHSNEIKAITLSSASDVLASAANGSLKIWNVNSMACIRTFECGFALCLAFILTDRYLVLGTKEGDLELYNVASSTLVETIKAHDGPIQSLQVHPEGHALVTGSSDKSVKFWRFDTVNINIVGTTKQTQQLTLKHVRTLKMTDEVLSLHYSPDSKLLAVSLLDSTVKVFFADTLKFFLSLYGHKLPVLAMDISNDNKLLVTCSADKNVKIWGLDFGDCHKSIFAHDDSILQVQFEREGHNFFTTSKDKFVKYWDGDKFENILRMDGHHAEVTSLAVSGDSEFVVSAGSDKSIRIWRQSDDPVFLEEEREKELEEIYETQLAETLQRTDMHTEQDDEAGRAGQATTLTLMAGEKLMEALELAEGDRLMMIEYEKEKQQRPNTPIPARTPLLMAMGNVSAERHVLNVAQKIKAGHLEDALLVLPFDKVIVFLQFLDLWAHNEWDIPLTTKILLFLLSTHHSQIVANQLMRPMLDSVRGHLRAALQRQKNVMGFNVAALTSIKRDWEIENQKDFTEPEIGVATKKRAFATLL